MSLNDLDNVLDTLAQELPDVQEHAIAEHLQNQEKIEDLNEGFNPEIHAVNADGSPKLTKSGGYAKKRGKKAASSFVASPGKSQDTSANVDDATLARSAGVMAANLMIAIGVAAGGDEWHPRVDKNIGLNEKLMLETAFGDYFVATGKTDIPPGMVLTVAVAGYTLPRLTMPKTQERVSGLMGWIKKKLADRKLKKHGLKAEKIMEA